MKKKVLAILLVGVMVCSLAACGSTKEAETEKEEKVTGENQEVADTKEEKETEEVTQEETTEEQAADDIPDHPTNRVAHISYNGCLNRDIEETLVYNADGSYVVSGRCDNKEQQSSLDYSYTYNERGEFVQNSLTLYSAEFPDGITQEIDFVLGYAVNTKGTDDADIYQYIRTNTGYPLQSVNYLETGETSVDNNGKLIATVLNNCVYDYYGAQASEMDNGIVSMMVILKKSFPNDTVVNTSVETKGNKTFILSKCEKEEYDAAARSNIMKTYYPDVDVITYNEAELVSSIESYRQLDEQSIENLPSNYSGGGQDGIQGYIYYTYDEKGNMLGLRTRGSGGASESTVTYTYSDYTGASEQTETEKSDELTDVSGRWKCTSDGYDYDVIYFDPDGTGNLYHGIDAYPITYTFDGKKISMSAKKGSSTIDFTLYVYPEDGTIVEGESDAVYMRE